MAYEADAVEHWITDRLTTDGEMIALDVAGRIYRDICLIQPAVYPFIVFNFQGGGHQPGLGTCRVKTTFLYQIRVVTKGPPNATDRQIAHRIDRLFQTAVAVKHNVERTTSAQTVTDQWVITSRGETPVPRSEGDLDSKQIFYNRGSIFRIEIHPFAALTEV